MRTTIFGEIHVAKEIKSGKLVAIKVSRPQERKVSAEDPLEEISVMETIRREEETESKSDLDDGRNYVIKMVDSYIQMYKGLECHFNVMEFAEGGDIFERVQQEAMSILTVQRYFRMIVKGVSYLHKRNVCHLDLSLENILLTKEDDVKICDFGQSQVGRILESSGVRRGKLKYMSPEVFQRAEEYDGFKADAWSLGIILWTLLTGAFCYDVPNKSDKRFQYLARGKPGIEILLHVGKTDLPDEVVDLLTKVLTINPITRYTVNDILQHSWISEKSQIIPLTSFSSPFLTATTVDETVTPSPSCTFTLQEAEPVSAEPVSDSPSNSFEANTFSTLIRTPSCPITPCSTSSSNCSVGISSSASSSSSSSPQFSPSTFPPPPPVVEEAPADEAPSSIPMLPTSTYHVIIRASSSARSSPTNSLISTSSSSSSSSSSIYGPLLKRCKTITEKRKLRKRKNSLFRHFSEHRKGSRNLRRKWIAPY
jgi:serine/threonine protein kinase